MVKNVNNVIMQRNSGARLFPLLITLIVIALVIAAIVSIGRAVLNGNSTTNTNSTQADTSRQALLKTDDSRSVEMTVRGPIVADENFKSYRISISPTERNLDVYSGYLEDRTNGKRLDNNTDAYEQFVYALDKANMMKGKQPSDEVDKDLRGICAGGYVYEFSVLEAGSQIKKLWTSTCDGSKGTLDASKDQLGNLFQNQIPGAINLIPFKQSPLLRF
jgi:hypothetical protein